ncbi:uncharacterized protein B0I36DRAFT_312777 [Microdochium trichocladiopsis]|uniref:GPI anchored cell wall protein n=1 Tax=Microdochium trichocladiopsis TaxID=1682393 RepID=A0A9P8YJ16_9PEZI|nr:uncharacterized protein B0I36DRAFT_312777 [Microdochium trichocladiopsis]KAH7041406.1 hypothetical protein B0I36DRAFT_312777 [Microdochium trichocladiopsis]
MVRSVSLAAAAAAAGLVGTALARTTSVDNLFLPGFEGQNLVGRILTADKTSTEYFVQCDPNAESSFCGVGAGATVTMRPHTYDFDIRDGNHFTLQERCIITSDTADCTWSAGGEGAQATGVTTSTMTAITSADFFIPVTVTGGWAALQTNQLELRQALDSCLPSGITGVSETDFPTPTGKPSSTSGGVAGTGTASSGSQPTGKGAASGLERPAVAAIGAIAGLGALVMAL